MTNIVTYKSDNTARDDLTWCAFIVLKNGEYWGVRFNGATEEIARSKAIALWNKEQEKYDRRDSITNVPMKEIKKTVMNGMNKLSEIDPWAAPSDGRGHHFAGKVWMRDAETSALKRVALTEIELYEKNGWYRSGPRGK